jgi:DNA-binding NtrC family response regulator
MDAQENRKLVCLHHISNECSPVNAVEAAGWQIYNSYDPVIAHDVIKANGIRVGLVLLADTDPEDWLRQVEHLFFSFTGIEWVAIVAPSLLENPAIRDFIAGHFLDYHTLPVQAEKLLFNLGHASGMASLAPVSEVLYEQGSIIGVSTKTLALVRDLAKIAVVDAPILITGETGTGKELCAMEIHSGSSRQAGPFVAVNCAELPPTLIHAELFGYEKGAFTGAKQRKIGYLEQSGGGTIFLDEIGDLPIDLQVLLLRFLQQKTIRRVGGVEDIPVDARVIAATNVDLPVAVREGRFREDLYHRLNVLHLHVPALRDRSGDIEMLAKYFFDSISAEFRHNVRGFSRAALQAMNQYQWPGNVRELMNRIRRALVMSNGRMITTRDLGINRKLIPAGAGIETLEQARLRAEREAITAAMQQAGGNAVQAAEYLEVSRATLYRLLEKHGLTTDSWLDSTDDVVPYDAGIRQRMTS